MPFLYIYSPSDFVATPPAEQSAQAAGTPDFTLQLAPGATPTLVEVTDNDTIFDEIDGTQSLTNDVTIDGTFYAAGTTINSAYDLINTATAHKVTSLHFGGDGFQQGAIDGIVSTVELVPGQTYTFNTERTSHQQNNQYEDYFACFANGTLIATTRGQVPVEALRLGDRVALAGQRHAALRQILSRHLTVEELAAKPNLRPILISAGALGVGLPRRDLRVSPQHRMLVSSKIVERVCGTSEALLAATRLTDLPGIARDPTGAAVTYYHLVFDAHEVIYAEGAPSESFYPGPMAIAALAPQARAEFLRLFPDTSVTHMRANPACVIPERIQQRAIARRHLKNSKPLLDLHAV
ncbi:MAG: Hint domain-containing protein [Pseudomonadota bacterium]